MLMSKSYATPHGLIHRAALAPFVPRSPFDAVMDIWARWIKLDDKQHSTGDGHPQDTRELMQTGEAVDVMINALPLISLWAVWKSRGVTTVWRYPNASLIDEMQRAEDALTIKFRLHIATRRFMD